MERRRLTALIAGISCLMLGFAAGCTPAEPTPDAAATPAAGTMDKMAPAGGDKMAPAPGAPAAPPGPAGAAPK